MQQPFLECPLVCLGIVFVLAVTCGLLVCYRYTANDSYRPPARALTTLLVAGRLALIINYPTHCVHPHSPRSPKNMSRQLTLGSTLGQGTLLSVVLHMGQPIWRIGITIPGSVGSGSIHSCLTIPPEDCG